MMRDEEPQDRDGGRPYGDDGFESPHERGFVRTAFSIVTRSVVGVLAGLSGRTWPRQLPLDPPQNRSDYRP